MNVAGIVVSGSTVNVVIISGTLPFDCEAEEDFSLQSGDRPRAYSIIQGQITDFLQQRKVERAIIKASAISGKGGATEAFLLSAELRGIVQAAAINAKCDVNVVKESALSKLYGRKLEAYMKDEPFWKDNLPQLKKKTLRKAALLAVLDQT